MLLFSIVVQWPIVHPNVNSMNKNLHVPSQGKKYSDISLTKDDISQEEYKKFLGGGAAEWELRGEFQLLFLQSMGLKPDHKFLDVGCGPGRAARFLIDFLSTGNYTGMDYNPSFIAAAEHMAAILDLSGKNPTFDTVEDFGFPPNYSNFDYCIVFSVLNHCNPEQRLSFFKHIPYVMATGGKIYISHCKWMKEPTLNHKGLSVTNVLNDCGIDITKRGWQSGDIFPIVEITKIA